MAVQVLSDLHLEIAKDYDTYEITPKAPYLALLGDIGNLGHDKDKYLDFMLSQLKKFRIVFLVPGNHEPYHTSWSEALSTLRDFEREIRAKPELGEFVLLDRRTFQLPETNIVVLGCSLFSSIPDFSHERIQTALTDFYVTQDWSTDAHHESHLRDLAWLNEQVLQRENDDVEIMIFTHWSPSTDSQSLDPRHAGSSIACAFSTDMSNEPCFQSRKVKLWAFGHTHYNCDFLAKKGDQAGYLRLVTNQQGYRRPNVPHIPCFDPRKTVDSGNDGFFAN